MVSTGRTLQGPGSFQRVSLSFSCMARQLLSRKQHFVCIHTAKRPIANFTNVGLIRASILYSRILLFTMFFLLLLLRTTARQHQTAVTKRAVHGKTADLRSCCILFLRAGKRQHYCHQAINPPHPCPVALKLLKTKACRPFGGHPAVALPQTLFLCPSDEVIRELKMYTQIVSVVQFPAVVFHLQPTSNCFPHCVVGRLQ